MHFHFDNGDESVRFFPSIQIPLFWVKVEWNGLLKLLVWTKVESMVSSFSWSVLGLQCPRTSSKTLLKLSIRMWTHPLIIRDLYNLFFLSISKTPLLSVIISPLFSAIQKLNLFPFQVTSQLVFEKQLAMVLIFIYERKTGKIVSLSWANRNTRLSFSPSPVTTAGKL